MEEIHNILPNLITKPEVAEMALVDPVYYTSFGRIALGQSAL
jgi:hypothetical protein